MEDITIFRNQGFVLLVRLAGNGDVLVVLQNS